MINIAPMTPEAFRAWRKRLGMTQDGAARTLGKTRRTIQRYEDGDLEIPKTVRLAMAAVTGGFSDFDFPTDKEGN